jgi:hypothetical protein
MSPAVCDRIAELVTWRIGRYRRRSGDFQRVHFLVTPIKFLWLITTPPPQPLRALLITNQLRAHKANDYLDVIFLRSGNSVICNVIQKPFS